MAKCSRWFLYDALLDSVPATALVKRFTFGRHWLMIESDQGGIGMAQHFPPVEHISRDLARDFDLIGQPLGSVAELLKSWDFTEASLGLAALNAANNTLALVEGNPLHEATDKGRGDAFDFFLPLTAGKKVAVIGHFPRLYKIKDYCELSILERKPRRGDLPDTAAEYILPEQDFVYITGTTFVNKTITRLLELTRNAVVCLVGPSTPMHPLLFDYGFASLSGLVVVNYECMAEALEGNNCEVIFTKGGAKVNMINEARV